MLDSNKQAFLSLTRLGVGVGILNNPGRIDWDCIKSTATEQGLSGVVLDGIDCLSEQERPRQEVLLQWIGQMLQKESQHAVQQKAAGEMAMLFHNHGIKTYVLKGEVIAECYPKPSHRVSVDMDCFLVNETQNDNLGCSKTHKSEEKPNQHLLKSKTGELGNFEVWELGNRLVEEAGYKVSRGFYKNSTFYLPGLVVENHRFLTPFRGNKTLKELEAFLQSQLRDDSLEFKDSPEVKCRKFAGTELWRPPVMVSALFLIEHAYSHFLHEGLTWRMVLDWVMFTKKHKDEINWSDFNAFIDEFGFRKFYDVFNEIGQDAFGDDSSRIRELENSVFRSPDGSKSQENHNQNLSNSTLSTDSQLYTLLSKLKSLMLADIWAPLDLHETIVGWKGKLNLVGNTWRARWKYRYFTNISWFRALWIQIKGVLFMKHPTLD